MIRIPVQFEFKMTGQHSEGGDGWEDDSEASVALDDEGSEGAERRRLKGLRVVSRSSAGVRLFRVAGNEHVVSVAPIDEDEEPENEAEELVAADLGEAPPAAAADTVQLDDGTGPETLPDSQE
jgi:hypothetical protein